MRIGIYIFKEKDNIREKLISSINENGHVYDDENPEIVIYVGGDGTFLRAVNHYISKLDEILFVGIKTGKVGFFYDFLPNDIDLVFNKIKEEDYSIRNIPLLKCDATYGDEIIRFYAINEVRIEKMMNKAFTCDVLINREKLETFRGSGLVISSSVGSSAYNKDLGGAIVDPETNTIQITGISPISNNEQKNLGASLILPPNKNVEFKGGYIASAYCAYDCFIIEKENLTSVKVTTSSKFVRVVTNHASYIQKLKKTFLK